MRTEIIAHFFVVILLQNLGGGNGEQFGISYYYKNAPSVEKPSRANHEEKFSKDNLKTVVVIHGWNTETLQRPLETKDEIFENRKDVGRVIIIDWTKDSFNKNYISSSIGSLPAQFTAKELTRIITNDMTSAQNIEIVGHGFGAHIAGQTGRKIINNGLQPLGLIIGLDPAGPCFENRDYNCGQNAFSYQTTDGFLGFKCCVVSNLQYDNRLQATDASRVYAIHTNGTLLGLETKISDNDIWEDGGKLQESCDSEWLWKKDVCYHAFAWDAYINQLRSIPLFEEDDSSQERDTKRKPKASKTLVNILVLDVSPSMQENDRIQNLVVASNRFVSTLPLGYELGIVIFGGYASASSEIVNITNESVRKSLIAALPTERSEISMTSIGSGLRMALDMSKKAKLTSCPNIILITDGEENRPPFISDVQPEISQSCAKINSIALGSSADSGLEKLSRETKGSIFTVSDTKQNEFSFDQLTQSLLDSSDSQLDFKHRPIKLPTKKALLNEKVMYTIDQGVGKDTQFALSSPKIDILEAVFTDPNGNTHDSKNPNYNLNAKNKEINFRVPNAIPGEWAVTVNFINQTLPTRNKRDTSDMAHVAIIFVTTYQKKGEEAIRLDANLNTTVLEYPNFVKIQAVVVKGENKVVSAFVNAHIKSPTGKSVVLQLWDNGAGADEIKNDGIYSRHISKLEGKSRHEVSVIATSMEETNFVKNGKHHPTGRFERLVNVGSIKAVGKFLNPRPGKVTDLRVVSVNMTSKICTLNWTATGEEADVGKVTEFSIMALGNFTHVDDTVNNTFVFRNENVLNAIELEPKEAGEMQIVNLKIPDSLWNNSISTKDNRVPIELYFTVQSKNQLSQVSDMSNIADTFTYFYYSVKNAASSGLFDFVWILITFLMSMHFAF